MCSGSKAGSYLRLIDFEYHSTLGVRVIKKKKRVAVLRRESGPTPNAGEREGNNFKGLTDVHLKNGSSQGLNLALTLLSAPNSSDSGSRALRAFKSAWDPQGYLAHKKQHAPPRSLIGP